MPTPFCNKQANPCDFEEWYACSIEAESEESDLGKQQDVEVEGNTFVVWTRFKGFMTWIYNEETEEWVEGEKMVYQTTVDLPSGVPFDPENPYHVKYYNQKRHETMDDAEAMQQAVKTAIINDEPLPDAID